MPRPTKAFRRQRVDASIEWKRGNKKEAYELWEKAAQGLKEHQAKKRNKKKAEEKPAAESPAPAE